MGTVGVVGEPAEPTHRSVGAHEPRHVVAELGELSVDLAADRQHEYDVADGCVTAPCRSCCPGNRSDVAGREEKPGSGRGQHLTDRQLLALVLEPVEELS